MKWSSCALLVIAFTRKTILAEISVTLTTGADLLASTLLSPAGDLNVVDARLIGGSNCSGIFSNAQSSVNNEDIIPDEGIVLSSGSPQSLPYQDASWTTVCYDTSGDTDLDLIIGPTLFTQDACILEIDFEADPGLVGESIQVEYSFGSEDYRWIDSEDYNWTYPNEYNDVFALFLNGMNIALVPGTTTPISVNTVNSVLHSVYYIDNDYESPSYPDFEPNGFTRTMVAQGLIEPGVNTMAIKIADGASYWDCTWDAWVLLSALTIGTPNSPPVASCKDVVVKVGKQFSIDNGSYDPDGDPIILDQSSVMFSEPIVADVTLTVTDDKGDWSQCTAEVAAYDRRAGFVSGRGRIKSPKGSFTEDPDIKGTASFRFAPKYQKGMTVPEGKTLFTFVKADINFEADTYDWLVLDQDASTAQFKGTGSINGESGYKIMVWAKDGTPDMIRIKIWLDSDGSVIYDNGALQELDSGEILLRGGS